MPHAAQQSQHLQQRGVGERVGAQPAGRHHAPVQRHRQCGPPARHGGRHERVERVGAGRDARPLHALHQPQRCCQALIPLAMLPRLLLFCRSCRLLLLLLLLLPWLLA